jgi:predicted PurR-regulated permease PerM
MADVARTLRVRLSLRSSLAVVFALGATVLVLSIAVDAERVIAWILAAAAIAALVYPAVDWLAHFRFVPRGLAVGITAVVMLSAIGFVGYRIVDDVTTAMSSLQEAAPERAADLERDSEFFREIKLQERVTKLVDAVPERLAGGEAPEALRSAASRGVAAVVGIILTIFFVLYGNTLIAGGLSLLENERTRTRTEHVFRHGSRRALFYTRVKLWAALIEGLLAFAIARAADVPGPAALGVWVGLWSLLPVAGVLIGALPIVIFAGSHTMTRAVVVALCFVAIGIFDWLTNRWLQRRAVEVGSFVIVVAMFAGLELFGLTGALLFVFGAILAVALLSELGPEEVAEVLAASPDPMPPASDAADADETGKRQRRINRRRE